MIRHRTPDGKRLLLPEKYYKLPKEFVNENYEKCKQFLEIAHNLPTAVFCQNKQREAHEDSDSRTQLHPVILRELIAIKTKGNGNW